MSRDIRLGALKIAMFSLGAAHPPPL
jgi:hypothetical protein